jgi:hypothetical protein
LLLALVALVAVKTTGQTLPLLAIQQLAAAVVVLVVAA